MVVPKKPSMIVRAARQDFNTARVLMVSDELEIEGSSTYSQKVTLGHAILKVKQHNVFLLECLKWLMQSANETIAQTILK